MENEIWYVKFLGGYIPCQWKGFAFQFFIVALWFIGMALFGFFDKITGRDTFVLFIIICTPILLIYNFVVISRHI